MFRWFFRLFFFKHLLSRFQWYRRWYGGIWEYWYIEMCYNSMWLDMSPEHCYPKQYPCTGRGTPIIENYLDSEPTNAALS